MMTPTPDQRLRTWTWLVLFLVPVLALLAWSGTGLDPRNAVPWTWDKAGWILPSPGLTFVWVSSVLLFGLLSAITWLLVRPVMESKTISPWVSRGLILALAVISRIVVARKWIPLPLDPHILAARILPASVPFHWLMVVADVVVIGLLLLALHRAGRSPWWAALYALHPLAIIEIAGNGHFAVLALIPLLLIVMLLDRCPRWAHLAVSGLVALLIVGAVGLATFLPGFNSLGAEMLAYFGVSSTVLMPAIAALLLAGVLVLGVRREWPLSKMLVHVLVIGLICSPIVQPSYVLLVVVLMPLAWTRSGWAMSLLVLGAYAVVPIVRDHGAWHLPLWLLMLEWVPVMVLEAQELLAESLSGKGIDAGASAAVAPPVP